MRPLHELRALIHAYQDFSECIVDAIEISDFGTTVVLKLDYIWEPDGAVRPDVEPKLVVELRFRLVDELRINNSLKPSTLDDPSTLSWGHAEIARIEILRPNGGAEKSERAVALHRMIAWREEGPWIEMTFVELDVAEHLAPPPRLDE